MNTKYLKLLEYNKIIDNLNNYCKTYIGKELSNKLSPSFIKDDVVNSLEFTKEAISLVYKKGIIPISDIPDISLNIKSLESYATLTSIALLNIARFLKISREVKEYFFSSDDID